MSDNDCNNSYCMLKMMCVKVHKSNWDRNSTAYALQGSFGEDSDTDGLKDTEWGEMARNWVDIQDGLDVINEEIDEAKEEMKDNHTDTQEDNDDE